MTPVSLFLGRFVGVWSAGSVVVARLGLCGRREAWCSTRPFHAHGQLARPSFPSMRALRRR